MEAGALAFGPAQRLLKASDFNRVFKQGKRLSQPELTLAYRVRPNRDGKVYPPRLGLSVSKKVGGAVLRNLLKRRIREIFRHNQARIVLGVEIVVIPRKEAGELSYQELEKRILTLFERGKLFLVAF
jgi:ribonuclease P protein component